MKVTEETVKHVAELARLNLNDKELKKMSEEMTAIITYFRKLDEPDTENVQPKEHVIPIYNVFRSDEAEPSFDREKILMNAPLKEDGAVKVPRIVE